MQILKLAGLFVVSFFSSFLIFALVLPSRFEINHFVEIERTTEVVAPILKDLKLRKEWYAIIDSNEVSSISVQGEGDAGSKLTWKNGTEEIISFEPKKIEAKIAYKNIDIGAGFTTYTLTGEGTEVFTTSESAQKTTLSWTLSVGPLSYPIGKIALPAVRQNIYFRMVKSLDKLKAYIEYETTLPSKEEKDSTPVQQTEQPVEQPTQQSTEIQDSTQEIQ